MSLSLPTIPHVLDVYADPIRVGDFLNFTPLMNATLTRIILEDNEQNHRISKLGIGLCLISFLSSLPHQTEWTVPGRDIVYWPRRLLDAYGFNHSSCLPKVKLSVEEIRAGHHIVSSHKNPIAIRDIQGYNVERNAPPGLMQKIVDDNPEVTFLSFGISAQHPSKPYGVSTLKNVVFLDDLPLRIVVACYYWIRRYVGVDTGAYHMMLAVGGKCDVWVPPVGNPQGYHLDKIGYPKDEWGEGDKQVLNYVEMTDPNPRSIIGLRYT